MWPAYLILLMDHLESSKWGVYVYIVHLEKAIKEQRESRDIACTLSLISALVLVGSQRHVPRALPPERPGTHCTGGWVGRRAGLDGCGISRSPLGFDPRTVQPVASRYTDWAIAALSSFIACLLTTRPQLSTTVERPNFLPTRLILRTRIYIFLFF